MSHTRRVFEMIVVCVVAATGFMSSVVFAQADDKIAADLANARERYEREISRLSDEVLRVLTNALDAAPRARDPEEARKQARDNLDTFRTRGQLPEHNATTRWEQAYAQAADNLIKAYVRASTEYVKQNRNDLEAAVNEESELFRQTWDFVPWQDRLTTAMPEAERTLTPGGTPLIVETGLTGEYRLEIKAKHSSNTGTLLVELPLPGSKWLTVPVLSDNKGNSRVLLTVREGLVIADLGATRPLGSGRAKNGENANLSLHADGGPLTVESVRVKPIVSRTLTEVQRQVRPLRERPAQRSAADLMPIGSVWRGEVQHNHQGNFNTRLEVKNVTGNTIIMAGSWVGRIRLEFVFRYSGTRLSLISVREESNTGGTRVDVSGSGSVSERGMSSSFSWRVSGGSLRQSPVHGTMSLQQQ